MSSLHRRASKPSALLTLVCLAVVARRRPEWVCVKLSDAAADSEVSAQRLSRLCTRAIALFETAVAKLCRVGRPAVDPAGQQAATEQALSASLLEVATSLLSTCKPNKASARSLVVGAWYRLKDASPKLTLKRFCSALAVSERTFRNWRRADAKPAEPPAAPPASATRPGKKPPPRRGRFGFDVTIPDTQLAADTTDLTAFGLKLKLIGAQDVGGRHGDLFDDVIVDDHESAALVIQVLTRALEGTTGQQVITDQGTPYLAEATRQCLEQLGADHAPQREGDPLGKATVERAFGTVKTIAGPILEMTNRLAASVKVLRNTELAKALTMVLITALLRAYQAGARAARRATEARGDIDEQALARLAQQSRDHAHAEDNSARLLLGHIHGSYELGGSVTAFIRGFRRFPLPVLQRAERAFASQAHRDDIRNRRSYFAAIVRRFNDEFAKEQVARRRNRRTREELERQRQQHEALRQRWQRNPIELLDAALSALADQCLPSGALLCNGAGIARAWLADALGRLAELHGVIAARDIVCGRFDAFSRQHLDRIGPAGIAAIESVANRHLDRLPTPPPTVHRATSFAHGILHATGPPTRSAPSSPLRT